MLKRNFRKLFILFGVIIFIFTFAGCEQTDKDSLDNKDVPQLNNDQPSDAPVDDTPLDQTDDTQNKDDQQDQDEEIIIEWKEQFVDNFSHLHDSDEYLPLDLYIQGAYSYVPSIKITVKDGNVYINDGLYQQATFSEPPVIVYSQGIQSGARNEDEYNGNQEISGTLQKIQESTQYYFLTCGSNPVGINKIIVCRVDNTFYFLIHDTNGEQIIRIFSAILEEEDWKDQVEEKWEKTFSKNFSGGKTSFTAEPYMHAGALNWVYSLEITVEDAKIYINDILYEQVRSYETPVIKYDKMRFVNFDDSDRPNSEQLLLRILRRIKESKFCYVLETAENAEIGKKIAVYKIDGVFYFVNFSEDGNVLRIHRAIVE